MLDPVASTQLHLAQSAILRLLTLFPHDRACRMEAAEYNRQAAEELACARDYAIVHYKANGRLGEPFWDDCRAMSIPDTLAHRMALYQSTGRVVLHDGETFETADWVAVLDALDIRARRYDPQADAIPLAVIQSHFARLRDVMLNSLATVPVHAEYIAQTCQARIMERRS